MSPSFISVPFIYFYFLHLFYQPFMPPARRPELCNFVILTIYGAVIGRWPGLAAVGRRLFFRSVPAACIDSSGDSNGVAFSLPASLFCNLCSH